MFVEHRLHFGGVDVLPAGDDHVLDPIDDVDKAVVVRVANVAGVEPPFCVDRFGGGVGSIPVSGHDVGAARADLAARTDGTGLAGQVEDG